MGIVQILARAVDGASHRSSRRYPLAYPLPRFVHRLMDNTHLSTTWEEEEQEDLGIKGGRQDQFVIRIRGCVKPVQTNLDGAGAHVTMSRSMPHTSRKWTRSRWLVYKAGTAQYLD